MQSIIATDETYFMWHKTLNCPIMKAQETRK